jgi:adenylate cyclase
MIGKTIAHYKIIEELGRGGMGVVYKAEDSKLKRTVALKVLPPDRKVTDVERARLQREAQAAAGLRHPNILTIFEIGEDNGLSYVAMDYIPGRPLASIVKGQTLDIDLALDYTIQIAQGLQEAHDKGIIHRDVKNENMIVDNNGHVSILDFGLAVLCCQPEFFEDGGTIAYMSPEQLSGRDVDGRTDIWSLGVCLFELITGRLPFQGNYDAELEYQITNRDVPSSLDFRPETPETVAAIIEKALRKDPAERYQHIEQILAELKLARTELKNGVTGDENRTPSIAVLPFSDLSSDQQQEYFCDGITEEIINRLAQVDGLRVVARTSSFAFKNKNSDIREIGSKLGVDTLLEGSVRKSGDQLRINAQLISCADGYHLWSEQYDRDVQDIFAIQDEIGISITDALRVTLSDKEKKALEMVPTTDVKAYDYYIRGRQYFHGLGVKGLEYARNMFTSAIIHDPHFALAYCGLADCAAMVYTYYDSNQTNIENAIIASSKALELDGELAAAHASYGLAVSLDGRYEEAEKELQIAIDLSPKLYEAYYFFARTCRSQGKLEQAAELFKKAGEVLPEDYQAPILMADTLRGLEKEDEMLKGFRHGLTVAEKHLEFNPDDARAWYLGAHALLELGDRERALEWNKKAMQLAPKDPATLYNAACLFCLMGEFEKCYECFDQAIDNGFAHRVWMETDPDLEAIRRTPRFKELLEQIN